MNKKAFRIALGLGVFAVAVAMCIASWLAARQASSPTPVVVPVAEIAKGVVEPIAPPEPAREPVSSVEPLAENAVAATALPPWAPENLILDPTYGFPLDIKQNLHWQINGSDLLQGKMVPPNYSLSAEVLEQDIRWNERKLILEPEETKRLTEQLQAYSETLAEIGKEEWRLKGLAMHEAIEKGEYLVATNPPVHRRLNRDMAIKGLQPVADQYQVLRDRFGEMHKDFCTFQVSLPAFPGMKPGQYIIYASRVATPRAFELYDQAHVVMAEAHAVARRYFDGLPPR